MSRRFNVFGVIPPAVEGSCMSAVKQMLPFKGKTIKDYRCLLELEAE